MHLMQFTCMHKLFITLFLLVFIDHTFAKFQSLKSEFGDKLGHINQSSLLAIQYSDTFNRSFETSLKGRELFITIDWNELRPNAYASFKEDGSPYILLTEGMLNHPLMTPDAINLVICHELGHFFAGSPKKNRGRSSKKSWASAEGQSDFYASAYCMKKLMAQDEKSLSIDSDNKYDREAEFLCGGEVGCTRIVQAAYRVAKVYAETKLYPVKVSLTEKSKFIAPTTILTHPEPQCRLDTMIAGALCPMSMEIDFASNKDSDCLVEKYSRPSCWLNKAKDP